MSKDDIRGAARGFGDAPGAAAMYHDTDTDETDALFSALSDIKKGGGAAIVPADDGTMQLGGWKMTATGLMPPQGLGEQEYKQFGAALFRLDTSMQWLIGDYINIGDNFHWGETYAQLADEFGYEEKTLRQYSWIARNVPLSVRTDKLSFGHHERVASMEIEEQQHWLEIAANEGLSIAKLRGAIKQAQLPARTVNSPGTLVITPRGHFAKVHHVEDDSAHVNNQFTTTSESWRLNTLRSATNEEIEMFERGMLRLPGADSFKDVAPMEQTPSPTPPPPSFEVGDYVQTRSGKYGTVKSIEGRYVGVSDGHYIRSHDPKTLKFIRKGDSSPPRPQLPASTCKNCGTEYTESEAWRDSLVFCQSCYEAFLKERGTTYEDVLPQVGDTVQTQYGGEGIVQRIDEKFAHVKTNVGTVIEPLEGIQSGVQSSAPTPPPPQPDTPSVQSTNTVQGQSKAFDYDDYQERADAWRGARAALEELRALDMSWRTAGSSGLNKARSKQAQQNIRNLIAHLRYIESTLSGD